MAKQSKSQYTTIYLVRHGEAEGNRRGILLGHLESSLTKKGMRQAKMLSQKLRGVRFEKVFSSDLSRAEQTAKIFASQHKLSVITTKLLRERFIGSFEGKKTAAVKTELKELLAKFKTLANKEKMEYKFDSQMESGQEVAARLIIFLKKIVPIFAGKTILAVTHAATMGAFLVYLGYADYEGLFTADSFANTSYVKIRTNGKKFFLD